MLSSERLSYRLIEEGDIQRIGHLANEPDIGFNSTSIKYPQPDSWARQWVANKLAMQQQETGYCFVIVLKGEVIGCVSLFDVDKIHQRGEIGYWLGKSYRGNGYLSEALKALTGYLFSQLHLNRIVAKTFPDNQSSQAALVRLGMTQEGVLRQNIRKDGKFIDSVVFSLLKEEWNHE